MAQETVSIELITPHDAAALLKTSPFNRNMSKGHEQKHVRMMTSGKWFVTPEGIGIDLLGCLREGHTRLKAIVAANVAVRMVVLRGMRPEAVPFINTGRPRSYGDAARFSGWGSTTAIAAAAKYAEFGINYAGSLIHLSHDETHALVTKHENGIRFAYSALSNKHRRAVLVGLIARAFAANQSDARRIMAFCAALSSGVVEAECDTAAIRLRDHLMRGIGGGVKAERETYAKAQSALRAFLDRKPMSRLYGTMQQIF